MRKEADFYSSVCINGQIVNPQIRPELTDFLKNGGISDEDLIFWRENFLNNSCRGTPQIWQTNRLHWSACQAIVRFPRKLFCPDSLRNYYLAQEVMLKLNNHFLNPDIVGYIGGDGLAVIEVGSVMAKDKKTKQVKKDLRILRADFPEIKFFGLLALYCLAAPGSQNIDLIFSLEN